MLRCQGSQTPLQVWNGPIHDAGTTWILTWGAIASFFFFFPSSKISPSLSFFLPSRALPFACPGIANFPSFTLLPARTHNPDQFGAQP